MTLQVLLLEARDRLGGRVYTVRDENAGIIELGAQWIHGGCPANALFNYASTRLIV